MFLRDMYIHTERVQARLVMYACPQHLRETPECLRIYMCWPHGWVDAASVYNEASKAALFMDHRVRLDALRKLDAAKSRRGSKSSQRQLTAHDVGVYILQVGLRLNNVCICACVGISMARCVAVRSTLQYV